MIVLEIFMDKNRIIIEPGQSTPEICKFALRFKSHIFWNIITF